MGQISRGHLGTFLLIALISIIICFYNLDGKSIGTGHLDELLHSLVTQDIVQNGNYLAPHLNGEVYNNKPPLKMWIVAAVVNILGESTFSYRLVDALTGTTFLISFFLLVAQLSKSQLTALFSFFSLVSCKALFADHGLRDATQDSFLNLLLMWVLYLTVKDSIAGGVLSEKRLSLHGLSAGLLLGLAALTKSVGAVVVLPIIIAHLWLTGDLLNTFKKDKRGICVFITAALAPITLYLTLRFLGPNPGSLRTMIFDEIITRAQTGYHNTTETFYYLNFLFNEEGALPAVTIILSLSWCLLKLIKYQDRLASLAVLWSVLPVALYSLSASKLSWYIGFAFPGLSLAAGILMKDSVDFIQTKQSALMKGIGVSVLSIVILLSLSFIQSTINLIKSDDKPNIADRISRKIQEYRSHTPELTVVNLDVVPHSISERSGVFYFRTITRPIHLTYNLISTLPQIRPDIVIMPYKYFGEVAKVLPPAAFSLFNLKRTKPESLVAAHYNSKVIEKLGYPEVIKVNQEFEVSSRRFPTTSGFKQRLSDGSSTVLLDHKGSHQIKARALEVDFGATYGYEVGLTPGSKPIQIAATLSNKKSNIELGSKSVLSTNRQWIYFRTEPQQLINGPNQIELAIRPNRQTQSLETHHSGVVIYSFSRQINIATE